MNLSLVKTATDEVTDAALEREAQWLRSLETVPDLEGQVPRLLEEGTGPDGLRFLRISIAPPTGSETRAFTPDHERFLESLGKARFRTIDFEHAGCYAWLHAAVQGSSMLRTAFAECEAALLYWTGPYVLSQGAFTPWNVRVSDSQLFVLDWGNARAEANPLDDVLHYLMVQRALCARPGPVELRAAMLRAGEFARRAYPEWSWREPVIGALTLMHLLGVVVQRAPGDPVQRAYLNLIEHRSAWMPAESLEEATQ